MKINSIIFFIAFILFSVVTSLRTATAQCTNQVTNLSGTSIVNGINVTVTSAGLVDMLMYCQGIATPYWVGQFNNSSGNGSYTFSFTPPVTGVTLNLSAISNIPGVGVEEVLIKINGFNYAITSLADTTPCEPMAVITPSGNIGGCFNCSGSGSSGINIITPISTLQVNNLLISGVPNGTVFSIFICDSVPTGIDNLNADNHFSICPNPFNTNLNISTSETQLLELTVYDLLSNKLIQQIFTNSASINTEQLAKGIYFYEVKNKNGIIKNGKVVKE